VIWIVPALVNFASLSACNEDDENTAPEALITSHADGDTVLEGYAVTFVGEVYDADEALTSLGVTWTTTDDVELCAGAATSQGTTSCSVVLEPGEDGITLTVEDSEGATASSTITLDLVLTDAPTAVILSPEDGEQTYANALIEMSGQISDGEDAPELLVAWWESDLAGDLNLDGTPDDDGVISDATVLEEGEHTLTLWVEDTSGKLGSDSVVLTVEADNTAPTCGITSPESGTTGEEGEEVTFLGWLDDDESDPDELTATWTSDLDGELQSGPGEPDGTSTLTTDALTLGSHRITLTVIDDSGAAWALCSDEVLYTIGDAPVLTLVSPEDGDRFDEGEQITFSAEVSDGDDSPNRLEFSWVSDLDGEFSTEGASSSGTAELTESGLSAGTHTLVVTATDSDGLYAEDTATFVVNALPTTPTISISPDPATTEDDLVAVIHVDSVDPEGDTVSYSYAWSVDGSLFAGSAADTVSATDTSHGETWTVEVTPSDSTSAGEAATASVTIDNTAPELDEVTLTPDPAYEADTLTCAVGTTTDVDDDAVTTTIAWTVGGSAISPTQSTLDGTWFDKGQEVSCTVTPSDSADTGTPVDSNVVTISNTPPSIDTVTVEPTDAAVDGTLTCAYEGFSDDDDDADASIYSWTIDGTEVGTSETLSGVFAAGDTVTCTVTPHDGEDAGTALSDSVVVENTPPELADVTLTPDPAYEEDTLTCTPGSTSDSDGHTVSVTTAWSVSGTDPGVTTATLTSEHFDKDDEVSCTVTPDDGFDDGDPVTSNTVTVLNSAPSVADATLSPEPAYEGDTLTCTAGDTDDADGDPVSLAYGWSVDGIVLSESGDTLDDSSWDKGEEVICTVTPYDGTDVGTAVDSAGLTISNSLPSIDSVSVTPEDPEVDDTLTCASSGYADADADADQSTYAWTIDGVAAGSGQTLSGSFAAGEMVTCTVTPNDGEDTGTAVSDSVAVANTPPVLASVSLTPVPAFEGDTLTCTEGSATDADGHTITFSYAWSVDSSDPGVTTNTLGPSWFGKDSSVTCTVTPSDGADDGDPVDSNTVTIGNTPPSIDSVTLEPDPAYETDTLTCTAEGDDDDDGDPVTLSHAWTVGGSTLSATDATLDGDDFDKGDEVSCTVTPNDGTDDGTAVDSNSVTISNSVPTLTSVTISPSDPEVTDTLTCTADDFDDDDGDSDQSTVEWTISGVVVGTDSTLSGEFVAGDQVTCTLTPYDGEDTGTAVSETVVVDNTPPVLASVTLSPSTAYEGDTFTCTEGSATDADGHTITFGYAWDVSGSDPGVTEATLGSDHFDRDDEVTCTVTPHDGADDGTPVASNTVTVSNTPPEISSVSLDPDPAYEASTLTCSVGSTSDADGDSVSASYAWTIDGDLSTVTASTLSGTSFDKGEQVSCTVTPDDGTDDGDAVDSDAVTISNTTPSISSVTISPEDPQVSDTLTCTTSGWSDDDGDSDSSTYSWTISGTEVGTGSTLSGAFSSGDQVTCTVTPNDGEEDGTAASDSITVDNSPPELAEVNLGPDPAHEGDTLTCTPGTVTDVNGDTVTYAYRWTVEASDPGVSTSTLSSDHWSRGDTVLCTVTPNDGTHDGTPVDSNLVIISNSPPEISSVSIDPDPGYEISTLTCVVDSASDADGDGISYDYEWAVDGSTLSTTVETLGGEYFDRDDEVVCTVTPKDDANAGDAVSSAALTISNTAPSIAEVTISPDSPLLGDTLTCTYSGYDDIDGDSDQSTTSWTIGGTEVGTSATLSGAFSAGDSVVCTVTPYDGDDTGDPISDTVVVANTPPVLSGATLTPDPAYEGDTFTCTPGSASDDDGDSVTTSYRWMVEGWDPGQTSATLDASFFARGDNVTCLVTPHDGTDPGNEVTSNSVQVSNTAPELSSVSLGPDPAFEGDTLTCSPGSSTDADGDGVSYLYDWTVDGLALSETSSSLTDASFQKDDEVYCTATPDDGTDVGVAVDSNTVTILNSPPSITTLSIDPPNPKVADTLSCSYSDFSDLDGDADQSTLSWTISGTEVGTSTTLSGAFVSGDQVTCTVTPSDGDDDGAQVSLTVTIENSAPVLSSVSLTPTTAWEGDTFTCTPGSVSDDDGDSVSYAYGWMINGWDPGLTSSTLGSGYYGKNDPVTCSVTPYDASDYGLLVTSNSVTVSNTVPEITSVSLSPTSPTTNETVSALVSTTDADGDAVSVQYDWYVDGTLLSATGSSLDGSSWFDKGQQVQVEVTPFDDEDAGTSDTSSTITAVNTPPPAPQVAIEPSRAEVGVDDLVCVIQTESVDDDGDTVTYTFEWLADSAVYPDDYGSATGPDTTTWPDDTIPAVDNVLATDWSCTVTPDDGEDTGGSATDSAIISDYTNVGNDVQFGSTEVVYAGSIGGIEIVVDQDSTVHKLAVITTASSGNVKVGLYTTDGSGPSALVVESVSTPLVSGALEVDVTATDITAGTYWFVAAYDQDTSVYADTSTNVDNAGWSFTFSDAMPDPFGSSSSHSAPTLNYYMVVAQ